MKRIYKYPLEADENQRIKIKSLGAEFTVDESQILSVAVQDDVPCVWALVDDQGVDGEIEIICHGTGHDADDVIPAVTRFIGTCLMMGGRLVLHFFARRARG